MPSALPCYRAYLLTRARGNPVALVRQRSLLLGLLVGCVSDSKQHTLEALVPELPTRK